MSLTKDDRDIVALIAKEVAQEVSKEFAAAQTQAMNALIDHHKDTCPHGRKLLESKWFLAGIGAVLTLLSAGGSAIGSIITKLVTGP